MMASVCYATWRTTNSILSSPATGLSFLGELVEKRVLSSLQPLQIIHQLLAASCCCKKTHYSSIKAGQNLGGSAASKVDLMRESNASLTLVAEIMHVDEEYRVFLLTKPHDRGPVQCRCARNLVQYNHQLTINETKPSSETISVWNKCGMTVSGAEAINRGNKA